MAGKVTEVMAGMTRAVFTGGTTCSKLKLPLLPLSPGREDRASLRTLAQPVSLMMMVGNGG